MPRRGLLTVANTVCLQKIKVTQLPVLSENKPALYIVGLLVHVLMCLRASPRCGPSNYNRSLCATGCKKCAAFSKGESQDYWRKRPFVEMFQSDAVICLFIIALRALASNSFSKISRSHDQEKLSNQAMLTLAQLNSAGFVKESYKVWAV